MSDEKLLLAVDRVHRNETLEQFWRHGELVPNLAHSHPFQAEVPPKYQATPRWYMLDTDLDPPQPWDLKTNLPVFSLALVRGERGARLWLLYAHSPLEDRRDVEITLPEFGPVKVDVPRAGAFYVVEESSRDWRAISP